MALVGAVVLTLAPGATPAVEASAPKTEAQQIIQIAMAQRGDPWRHGRTGPKAFDCSGLVIYSFTKAGDRKVIGNGKLRSARAMLRYFRAKGLASRSNPKPGDLVIWGNGSHVGIYIGKGKAISTLTNGVRVHAVHAVRAKFTAYLHTGMSTKSTGRAKVAVPTSGIRPEARKPGDTLYAGGSIPLRGTPVPGSAALAMLATGTKLVVVGAARDAGGRWWLQVTAGAKTGWVENWQAR